MSGRDGESRFGWRMNLFVFVALMVIGGFVVASMVTQRVIQKLQVEFKVEKAQ